MTYQQDDSFRLSSKELLNKRLIDFLFKTCEKGCTPLEEIGEHTDETGYVRMTMLAKSMMRKYMPYKVHDVIKKLYENCEQEKQQIDNDPVLSEANKKIKKQRLDDDNATQVLEILMTVLFDSSVNVEHTEGDLTGDHDYVIKFVRNKKPVQLYGSDILPSQETVST